MRISPVSGVQYDSNLGGYFVLRKKNEESVREEPHIDTPLETLQAYSLPFNGYSCELKRLYKKGLIKIKYSFYGGKLKPKKFSVEHVVPRSKGGKSCQSNYVFCNAEQNSERGNSPLAHYIDWEAVGIYLKQFEGIKVKNFDGDEYIKDIIASIDEALHNHY